MIDKEYIIYSNKYSLQERKTKTSGTVYDVYFRVWDRSGKCIQKKLGGLKTKTEAKFRYNRFVQDHCEFVYDKPKRTTQNAEKEDDLCVISVGDAFESYVAWMKANCKPSTVYNRQKIYSKFIAPTFAESSLSELTKEKLSLWQDGISTATKANGEYYNYEYQKKIKAYFSAFLSWASDRYGTDNLLPKVRPPRRLTPKKEMSIWTREEFQRFIKCVDDPMYHAFFTLLFYTGRRRGEIMALAPYDVDMCKGVITFNKSVSKNTSNGMAYEIVSTKANKEQSLPVARPVLEELQKFDFGTPFLFGGEKPIAPSTLRRVFAKYTEIAGLKPIRIHDLRHSFVSMMIHLGVNLTVVADLIGDTLEQVTRTYAHMYTEDRDKAIRLLD